MRSDMIEGTLDVPQSDLKIEGPLTTSGSGGRIWLADAIRGVLQTTANLDEQIRGSLHLTQSR